MDNTKMLVGYLRDNGIDALCEKYYIKARRHAQYPNLISLKYSQIESPMSEPIVQACRGIVVNEDDWSVVARPYDKFFNIEEGLAVPVDWSTAKTFEKVDGSLIIMYHYDKEWRVGTSGTPDGSGDVQGFGFSFKELFWKTWNDLDYKLPVDENKTFLFELMTPYNRVVVQHPKGRIVLHGVRDKNEPYAEYDPADFSSFGWEIVKTYPLNNEKAVMEFASTLNGLECEGMVVVDSNFNRVKVKCADYLRYSHMKEGMSMRSMLDIVRNNEGAEFLAYFEEFRTYYDSIKIKYEDFVKEIEEYYESIKDIEVQKDFAFKSVGKKYSGVLFSLRKGTFSNVKEALAAYDLRKLEDMIGIENIVLSNL
jgi:hypothetical protein